MKKLFLLTFLGVAVANGAITPEGDTSPPWNSPFWTNPSFVISELSIGSFNQVPPPRPPVGWGSVSVTDGSFMRVGQSSGGEVHGTIWIGGLTGTSELVIDGAGSTVRTQIVNVGRIAKGSVSITDNALLQLISDSLQRGGNLNIGEFQQGAVTVDNARIEVGQLIVSSLGIFSASGGAKIVAPNVQNTNRASLTVSGGFAKLSGAGTFLDAQGISVSSTLSSSGFLGISDNAVVETGGFRSARTTTTGGSTVVENGGILRVLNIDQSTIVSGSMSNSGGGGEAHMLVRDGGRIIANQITIGESAGSTDHYQVTGANSSITVLDAGYQQANGSITIRNGSSLVIDSGGSVSAEGAVSLQTGSSLRMYFSNDSPLQTPTFANDGTVYLFAGGNLGAGAYTPIQATSFTGAGEYKTYGGNWINNTFAVGAVISGGLINANASGVRLGFDDGNNVVAFSSDAGVGSFEAVTIDSINVPGELLAAYQYITDLDTSALLSFSIGEFNAGDLRVWYRSDIDPAWTQITPDNLAYDGQWLNFTTDGFSSYAVTAVPEPSIVGLLVIAALGLLALRRRTVS